MKQTLQSGPSKRTAVEARIGMTMTEYFRDAIKRELRQIDMAEELGLSKPTVNNWLKDLGFRVTKRYQMPRHKAA